MNNELNSKVAPKSDPSQYDVEQLQLLDDLQHVRKRAGTYIGDLGTRGLHHLVHEVLDNSLDEAMAGFADSIEVIVQNDHSVTIRDNGRGIPVAMDPRIGVSALEGVMTLLKYGGKFDDSAYDSSGGLNGMGMKAVNFLSLWCRVTVQRDGKIYHQSYTVGKPDGPVIEKDGAQRSFSAGTGTEVSFLPDPDKFGDLRFDPNVLRTRIQNAAFLNRGISIRFLDIRNEIDETYRYDRGLVQWIEHQHESISVLHKDVVHLRSAESGVRLDFAFQYNLSSQENIQSYANNIHNEEGGTHQTGFRNALGRTLISYAKREDLLKEAKLTGADLREGLTAIISIRISQPQFESQNKVKLTSPSAEKAVGSIVSKHLAVYWEENPETARAIIRKAIVAAKSRLQAIEYRKKLGATSQSLGGLPGKLRDCSSRDAERCEIYLVEGDSAGGSAEGGRLREFQAILPLRGKIINAFKYSAEKVLANEEVQSIIQALAIGTGDDIDLNKLRYHKVIIMSDADVDGSHIRTLLLSFFYRQMPELIERGHVFIAQPPLFRVRDRNRNSYLQTDLELKDILLSRGLPKSTLTTRDGRAFAADDLQQIIKNLPGNPRALLAAVEGLFEEDVCLDTNLDSNTPRFIIEGGGKSLELDSLNAVADAVRTIGESGIHVTRFKGLGEMNAQELRETTLLPEKRRLLQVTMDDAAAANELFQLLMGVSVEPRRRFIEDNALNARRLDV